LHLSMQICLQFSHNKFPISFYIITFIYCKVNYQVFLYCMVCLLYLYYMLCGGTQKKYYCNVKNIIIIILQYALFYRMRMQSCFWGVAGEILAVTGVDLMNFDFFVLWGYELSIYSSNRLLITITDSVKL